MTTTKAPIGALTPTSASRRDFIKAGGGALLLSGAAGCLSRNLGGAADAALANPLYYSSAGALAAAIGRGELTSETRVTACLARIQEVNPALNAVVQLAAEAALERAREADIEWLQQNRHHAGLAGVVRLRESWSVLPFVGKLADSTLRQIEPAPHGSSRGEAGGAPIPSARTSSVRRPSCTASWCR